MSWLCFHLTSHCLEEGLEEMGPGRSVRNGREEDVQLYERVTKDTRSTVKLEASLAALGKGSIVRQKKVKASNTRPDTAWVVAA